jgi:hypothetical protein
MHADRRLYLDRTQSRLVGESDPECAWLLAARGHEIAAADVKRLDLRVWADGTVQQGPEPVVKVAPAWEPKPAVVSPEPLADVVRPAGAMPEPIMPPQAKRTWKKKS